MTKYYGQTFNNGDSSFFKKRRKHPWLKALKILAWVVGGLIVACGVAVWIIFAQLTPQHIKHLIEEKSPEYINGRIYIASLDYRLFHSFPWLEFEVDSLTLISHSIDVKGEGKLPVYADSLASVAKIEGKINIHSLIHKKINLKDIEIDKPRLNIVMVNDSVTNYNIAREMPHIKKIPEVKISEVKVEAPLEVTFFSLADSISADVKVNSFYLTEQKDRFFKIGFEGLVDGCFKDYQLPAGVPVSFTTTLHPEFPDLALTLNNLSVSLGGITVEVGGEIKADTKCIALDKAQLHLKISDIFSIPQYLPEKIASSIVLPDGIAGFIPIDLDVRLLTPFNFYPEKFKISNLDLDSLPAIECGLQISDADLTIHPPGGKKLVADDISVDIRGKFDPQNTDSTYVVVNRIKAHGEGISLNGRAHVSGLLEDNQNLDGEILFSSPLIESLAYVLPPKSMKIAGFLKGKVVFSATACQFGKEGLKDIVFSGDLATHSLRVDSKSTGKMGMKNMLFDFEGQIPGYPLSDYSGTKLGFDFSADSLSANGNGMNLLISGLSMKLDALDTISGSPDPDGKFRVNIKGLKADYNKTKFTGEDFAMTLKGTLNSSGSSANYTTVSPTSGSEDALIASEIKHTPLLLEYNGGGMLQTIMSMVKIKGNATIGKGRLETPVYLYPFEFSGVEVQSDLNNLEVYAKDFKIGRSSLSLDANLNGLNPFITSNSATKLTAVANVNFKNVDINQLSWGYYGQLVAQGKDSVFYVPPVLPYTAADSICVAIPRNIDAVVKLKANSAEYMGYKFSPLSTDIIVKNGDATLSRLTVGAPYATAVVDWTYSTSHLDNIFMDLKANVEDFNFSEFYKVFPSLTEKSPELKNFTGVINSNVSCRFGMFPSMFMDAASMTGRFDVKASELQFARAGKVERITHLMLIEGSEPIHIQNINIQGSFHDNLLQINPFKINFDDYQLSFGGINNTAGDMYYHFALEKSPFHLPFGVTLKGKFSHPQVNIGGTHIDDYKAELVTTDPDKKLNINIMAYLQNGWLLFLQEAAKYEGGQLGVRK